MLRYELEMVNDLKKEFNIKTNKYNKSVRLLIRQYIKRQISKESFVNILNDFAKA